MSDYDVGYAKPPKHSRFKKGRSGNAKGRPKGARNLKTDLKDVLEEELKLSMGGKPVKLSARRAMLVALRNKALKGDVRAISLFVAMQEKILPESLAEAVQATLGKDDLAIMAEAIKRHTETHSGKEPIS